MAARDIFLPWVVEALKAHDGHASVLEISKWIWEHHENDLRASGALLYSWQYDIRWAAYKLREDGVLAKSQRRGLWKLA